MIYHVAKSGADHNSGTENAPFLTIQRAADVAQPGDTVLVHEGVYREWVRPRAGGTSDACRITYAAANGEHVTVKGSERVDWWQRQEGTVWKAVIPNRVFGKENPYKERVWGDWLVAPIEPYAHLGAVYMNGQAFYEAFSYGAVCAPEKREYSRYETWAFRREAIPEPELTVYQWYAEAGEEETVIYANFHGADPNRELVEINVRTACFFPEETNLNYITVRGFEMAQAACPWAPPTSRQLGLLGCHWSKGWIIENNHFHHAKCSAVSLGKEISTGDNEYTKTGKNPGYQTQMETVFRGIHAGWRKDRIGSHIVRNNQIHDCGQNAIVGHMGCAFSEIYGNEIYNIAMGHEFYGHEIAGIKFHGAVDTHIHHNYIHHCTLGLWLDWQAQGVRVSGNVFTENYRDLMIEVTHGPHLVDNNVFGSDFSLVNAAQGGAYVYNLFGGFMQRYPVLNRATPYHFPHSTDVLGVSVVYGGDDRWLCNLFAPQTVDPAPYAAYGTADYNGSPASLEECLQRVQSHGVGDVENFEKIQQPVYINGNAYTGGARHFDREGDYVELKSPMGYRIAEDGNTVYLEIEADPALFPMPEYRITAEDLPQARIVRQGFENADAMPAQIEKGWLRELRPGYNRIALWHKKKTDI